MNFFYLFGIPHSPSHLFQNNCTVFPAVSEPFLFWLPQHPWDRQAQSQTNDDWNSMTIPLKVNWISIFFSGESQAEPIIAVLTLCNFTSGTT